MSSTSHSLLSELRPYDQCAEFACQIIPSFLTFLLRDMEQLIAEQKARELQIDRTQVVREYWELIILKGLYDSPFGRNIIFKGGTALRLAYASPRFSEGLEFSLTPDALKGKFPD